MQNDDKEPQETNKTRAIVTVSVAAVSALNMIAYGTIVAPNNTSAVNGIPYRVGEVMIGADNGIFWTTGGGFSDR